MMPSLRRVITGLDAEGRSCIIIDGSSPGGIWSTDASPADNSSNSDVGGFEFTFDIPVGGARMIVHDFPPGQETPMHASDTIDYIAVLSGEVTFITETGETLLRAGDVLVDRGAFHGWHNHGKETCRIINVLLPSHPVGRGATV